MIIVFVLLLLTASYGIKKLFGYCIEESLFINILFTIVFLLITGLIGALNIGFYIILAFMIVLSIAGISITVKRKAFDIYEIITPGMAVLALSCLLYFISVRDIGFHRWDEVSHWGTAVKHMYLTNQMYFGLQTMGLPVFSYFMVRIAGYNESLVYLSRWMFMWSGIVMLMKDVKWKSWYLAAIGWLLSACIVNIIAAEPMYYMDKPLGVLAGVLIAYLILDKKGGLRKDILVFLGVVVLPHVKDSIGLEMAVFVLIFNFISGLISGNVKNKGFWAKNAVMLAGVVGSYLISGLFKSDKLIGYYNIERLPDLGKFFSLLTTKSMLMVYALFVIVAVLLIGSFKNSKLKDYKYLSLIRYTSLTVLLISFYLIIQKVILGLYQSFESQGALYYKNALRKMFYESFYGKPTYILLLFLVAFTILMFLLHKKKSIKDNAFNILSIAVVLMHGLVLALLYSMTAEPWQGNTMSSYTRYYMIAIVIASFVVLVQILYKENLFIEKTHKIIAIGALSLLLLNTFPVPHDINFIKYDAEYKSIEGGLKDYARKAAVDVNSAVPEDSDVFVICQNNGEKWADYGLGNWIHYYILPRETNFISFSFGDKYYDDDKLTEVVDTNNLQARIADYDYIYIDNADEDFYARYGGMFDALPNDERAIYEVSDDGFKLIWEGESIR